MTKKTLWILFLTSVLLITGCTIKRTDEADLIFTLKEDGTYSVAAAEGFNSTSLTVPDEYKGIAVTEIASNGFEGRTTLKTLIIPESITVIGEQAFKNCTALKEITVPFIGRTAETEEESEYFGYLFGATDYTENPTAVPEALRTVTLTSGNSIISNAFAGCSSLTTVNLPDTVTDIGDRAFEGCRSLGEFKFPNALKTVGEQALKDCESLSVITVPSGTKSIGFGAFQGCEYLSDITLPFVGKTESDAKDTHFGYVFGATDYQTQKESIPESLCTVTVTGGKTLESRAFYECVYLTKITLPETMTKVGEQAFYGCAYLEEVIIPKSVKTIEPNVLEGCINLKILTVPFIGKSIHYSYTYLGYFFGATSITNQRNDVPANLRKVILTNCESVDGFSDCSFIEEIVLPDNATVIGASAFYNCYALKKINIPSGITDIGTSAFSSCQNLTEITLPVSLYTLYSYAFSKCTKLTDIYYEGTWEQWCSVTKEIAWKPNTPEITLHCTDRVVENYLDSMTLPSTDQ